MRGHSSTAAAAKVARMVWLMARGSIRSEHPNDEIACQRQRAEANEPADAAGDDEPRYPHAQRAGQQRRGDEWRNSDRRADEHEPVGAPRVGLASRPPRAEDARHPFGWRPGAAMSGCI